MEADNFLKQYFLWYYVGHPYYTADTQVKIPNSSVDPRYKGGNGYCDLLLYDDYAAEIYELKKYTNDCARWHSKDVDQLNSYIEHYQKQKDTSRGTIFNPTGLLIQSELNPQYYIQYYTHYNKTHILLDPETGKVIIDSETGEPKIENYQGFIYWKYVKIENTNLLPYTVWIRNKNGQGGAYETDIQNRIKAQVQQDWNDDIAAVVGWVTVGGILWFGAKVIESCYGQWWVWACP